MRIVVVGGGYAGTFAANRLARATREAEITLINPRRHFVERVRLHQHIAQTATAATPMSTMLHPRIRLVVADADAVRDGDVRLRDGRELPFDRAIIAVGSSVEPIEGTVPVGSWEGAGVARGRLARLAAGATVSVIGGGPTGIETAAEIAGARPDLQVRLVARRLAQQLTVSARDRIRAGLARLDVQVVDDAVVAAASARGGRSSLHLASGGEHASDLTLWAIVGGVPDLVARSGLAVTETGRGAVAPTLRSPGDGRIAVIGDCADVPGARMACQTALPQAKHAADTLLAELLGREIAPYRSTTPGLGVSLGRRDAVGQFPRRDGRMKESFVAGFPAVVIKEIGSRGARFVTRRGWGV